MLKIKFVVKDVIVVMLFGIIFLILNLLFSSYTYHVASAPRPKQFDENWTSSDIQTENTGKWHVRFVNSESVLAKTATLIHKRAYNITTRSGKCEKRLPQVLVLGVWKCGTRELTDFLSIHPHVVVKTKPYEPNYFSKENLDDTAYSKYRQIMPCSYKDQLTLVKNPWYFSSGKYADRIHKFNSSLKMIVLVREPVARLLSSVTFNFQGTSRLRIKYRNNINRYFRSSVFGPNNSIIESVDHVKYSRYIEGYTEYVKHFKREQLYFIDALDFKRDPYKVIHNLESFLGIQHFVKENHFAYNPDKNFYCLRHPDVTSNGSTAACYANTRGRTNVTKKLRIDEQTNEKLKNYFKPYNERFFEAFGSRFDW